MRRGKIFALSVLVLVSACKVKPPYRSLTKKQFKARRRDLPANLNKVVFAAIGDSGNGSADQFAVGRAMANVCQKRGCHFVTMLGDIIYPDGVESVEDSQWQSAFERPYAGLQNIDFWSVLGNHDWKWNAQAHIDYSMLSDKYLMPAASYAIPDLPEWLSIYGMDSTPVDSGVDAITFNNYGKAKRYLCRSKSDWKILFSHHPVVTSSKRGLNKKIARRVDYLAKKCDLDVYLTGHDHHLEHLRRNGMELVLSGAGGASIRPVKVPPVKGSQFAVSQFGFALFEITKTKLTFRFYNKEEQEIYSYKIEK